MGRLNAQTLRDAKRAVVGTDEHFEGVPPSHRCVYGVATRDGQNLGGVGNWRTCRNLRENSESDRRHPEHVRILAQGFGQV